MKDFWDERYQQKEYIYGKEPNVFFAEQIKKLQAGKIILPCEGEGRNAVYAAQVGWEVHAFDSSEFAKIKAVSLAEEKDAIINYYIADATKIDFDKNAFDVVAFIYAHFPPEIRQQIHKKAITWLKPGGKIFLEAFNPQQLHNQSGGPKDISMLYTIEMMNDDFQELNIDYLETMQIELNEGNYHKGKADVLRFIGTKKSH